MTASMMPLIPPRDIKSSDTFDIWMDTGHRVVYKVRLNDTEAKNPADNYVDIGLDYKGGSSYPFFIAGSFKGDQKSDDSVNFKFVTTLDTKAHNTNFKLDVKSSGAAGGTASANFDFKPSTAAIKIEKPASAKPLSQVLSELGYGDVLSQFQASSVNAGVQDTAKDSKRKTDIIQAIQTQLEAFFTDRLLSQSGRHE